MLAALSKASRCVARNPVETIAYCTIVAVCACYFLWQSIKQNDLFAATTASTTTATGGLVDGVLRFPEHIVKYTLKPKGGFELAFAGNEQAAEQSKLQLFAVALHNPFAAPKGAGSARGGVVAPKRIRELLAVDSRIRGMQFAVSGTGNSEGVGAAGAAATISSPSSGAAAASSSSSATAAGFSDVCARDPGSGACLAFGPFRHNAAALAPGASVGDAIDPKLAFLLARSPHDALSYYSPHPPSVSTAAVFVYVLNTTTAAQASRAAVWSASVDEAVLGEATACYSLDAASKHQPRGASVPTMGPAVVLMRIVAKINGMLRSASLGEVVLVCMSYAITIATFINTFVTMRRYGSRITLALSVIFSGFSAFVLAVVAAHLVGCSISVVLLTEALPFLVICVGFDKSLTLTRSVLLVAYNDRLRAEASSAPASSGGKKGAGAVSLAGSPATEPASPLGSNNDSSKAIGAANGEHGPANRRRQSSQQQGLAAQTTTTPSQIQSQITRGVAKCAAPLIKDYLFEIGILCIGVGSGVPHLREMCFLSSLILFFDGILMFTLYTAILTLKLDIIRVRSQRKLSSAAPATDIFTSDDDLVKDATPAFYKHIALKALSDDEARSENKAIRKIKAFVLVGFIFIACIESNTLFSMAGISLPSAAGSLSVAPTRFVAFDEVVAPALRLIAASGAVPPLGSVSVIPITSWAVGRAATSVAAAAAAAAAGQQGAGGIYGQLGSGSASAIITALAIVMVLSLGANVYVILIRGAGDASGNGKAGPGIVGSADYGSQFDYLSSMRIGDYRRHSSTSGSGASSIVSVDDVDSEDTASERSATVGSTISESSTIASASGKAGPSQHAHGMALKSASALPSFVPRIDSTTDMVLERGDGEAADADGVHTRSIEVCRVVLEAEGAQMLNDAELISLVQAGAVPSYKLEKVLNDDVRAIKIRRAIISRASATRTLEASLLPYTHYDYSKVHGQCCENVIGIMPIPVGVAGPIRIDGELVHVPMATTEGALVASTSRGCKAITMGSGAQTILTQDGMTRGPCLQMPDVVQAGKLKEWLDSTRGFEAVRGAFESTSRFAKLRTLKMAVAGRLVFVRFSTFTGDAMGMNMISKGCEKALELIVERFPACEVISVSGNFCMDKKPAAINWVDGRGKSVAAEAVIPGAVVRKVLKTTVADLCRLNVSKNLVGSAMAGSIGGFNAHAANTLTAVYLATGQDPAQNVESSMCITLMEPANGGEDLRISCSMPSVEVGTIGGGTTLPPQAACLDMLGCRGPNRETPGANAQRLARIICAAVMAGELSLCAALAAGHLVKSHISLNRATPKTPSNTPLPSVTNIADMSRIRDEAAANGR